MANRKNHYEAAFEAYLRDERLPYVAVDERRRALVGDGSLKSLDYIVSPAVGSPGSAEPLGGGYAPATRWLVDVKGRRFPSGTKQPQYWGNWSTEDDLRSLACWRQEFGGAFESALVFAYQLTAERSPTPPEQVFYHGDTPYAFVGIRLDDYRSAARRRSAKWGTVSVPIADFRTLAEPLRDLFDGSPPENTGSSPAGNAAFAPAQGLSAGVQ